MSATLPGALCALLPALANDIAAGVIRQLLAAVPRLQADDDPARADRALVGELSELKPRDLQEAMLAVQMLAAGHSATLCMNAAAQLDVASKDASRLRRDAAVQQRVVATLQRALQRAQARPMLADPVSGDLRPTVPPLQPRPAAAPRRPAATDKAEQPAEPPKPWPPEDVFDADPDLKALNDRWRSLPRWEEMTMEQRRQTWGYKDEPVLAAQDGQAAEPCGHG